MGTFKRFTLAAVCLCVFFLTIDAMARVSVYRRSYNSPASYVISGGGEVLTDAPVSAFVAQAVQVEACVWSSAGDLPTADRDVERLYGDFPPSSDNYFVFRVPGCSNDPKQGLVCGGTMRCTISLRLPRATGGPVRFTSFWDGMMCAQGSGGCRDATKCFKDSGVLSNTGAMLDLMGSGMGTMNERSQGGR